MKEINKYNIKPVVQDSIQFDGKMKPPLVKQPAGRPKKKCMRKRSKFLDTNESPIKCSICGLKGHNQKNCPKTS